MGRQPAQHRLRLGRYSATGVTYSVTICCLDRQPLLVSDAAKVIVAEAVQGMLGRGFARLDGYVIMPDHLRLVFELGAGKDLAGAVGDLKKYIARRINAALGRSGRLWQRGCFDHAIRGEEDYRRYLEYMLGNPVRAGLANRIDECPWGRVGPWEAPTA
ncbi:MAG: transposase [Armatimonadetes bacterium]|nr:transposase [Armatimonadota bacterium]